VKGLTFRSEQRGWHHGQSDETIYAMIDGAKVGRLEYNVYQGEASIDYIHVDEAHRRKGVGRALFQELKKAHRKVRWTATTPDGEALRQAVDPPRPKKAQAEDPRKSFSEKDYDLVLSKIHDARSSGDKRAEARLKRLVSRMNTWDRNLENHRLLKKGLLFGQDAFKARSPGAKDKPSLREV
jgi:GNAT superfamily N-acetyltransferase